jgi:phosphatidylinositol kinase/protein kinase (PI-3  family)
MLCVLIFDLYSYRVLVTSDNSGLIETIRNTMSIHSIKKTAYTKQDDSTYTLRDFFEQVKEECWFAMDTEANEVFLCGICRDGVLQLRPLLRLHNPHS